MYKNLVGKPEARRKLWGLSRRWDDNITINHYILNILQDTGRMENTASNSSIADMYFFAAGTCLSSRCLATAVSSGSTIPDFWGHTGNKVIS
jgi:hypothetical protein